MTDADVRAAVDALVSSGMRDAGYTYVNVDDTWQGQRDAQGQIHSNDRFPDMKALADYVHSKGLKFGIYSSPGPKTCAGFEGSYGHEDQDAQTYAAWGVDFLKYDLCGLRTIMGVYDPQPDWKKASAIMREAYVKMHKALLKAGRPSFTASANTVQIQYGSGELKWAGIFGALQMTSVTASEAWL